MKIKKLNIKKINTKNLKAILSENYLRGLNNVCYEDIKLDLEIELYNRELKKQEVENKFKEKNYKKIKNNYKNISDKDII